MQKLHVLENVEVADRRALDSATRSGRRSSASDPEGRGRSWSALRTEPLVRVSEGPRRIEPRSAIRLALIQQEFG
jgi:hypothetical protein